MTWRLEHWHFDGAAGTLTAGDETRRLEPKVADLLSLLAQRSGRVVTREEIQEALWPGVVVGDESLARCVSKLRKALGDTPRTPRFIETVPKRGYRLLVDPTLSAAGSEPSRPGRKPILLGLALVAVLTSAVALLVIRPGTEEIAEPAVASASSGASTAEALTERAHDFYSQITRTDNESAIALYERVIAEHPTFSPAQAGLANALVQRVLRWPVDTSEVTPLDQVTLTRAIASGRTRTESAQRLLLRALGLAERAVRLAPEDAAAHKALGFVQSALERDGEAIRSYERAIELDPAAWDAMINLSELQANRGDEELQMAYLEQAFDAMATVYTEQAPRVRPWHSDLGVLIGNRRLADDDLPGAELWFRRVLVLEPFHQGAISGLASVLRRSGDAPAADRLCAELEERTASPCAEPDDS